MNTFIYTCVHIYLPSPIQGEQPNLKDFKTIFPFILSGVIVLPHAKLIIKPILVNKNKNFQKIVKLMIFFSSSKNDLILLCHFNKEIHDFETKWSHFFP